MVDVSRLSLSEINNAMNELHTEITILEYNNECSKIVLKYLIDVYYGKQKKS